jgi:hypothetical protein
MSQTGDDRMRMCVRVPISHEKVMIKALQCVTTVLQSVTKCHKVTIMVSQVDDDLTTV